MTVLRNNAAKAVDDPERRPMRDSSSVNFLTLGMKSASITPYHHIHVNKRSMTKESPKKTKRLCVPATKHDKDGSEEKDDKIDLKRNEESANGKFKLFGSEIEIPQELVHDEENKENLYTEKNEELANGKLKLFGCEIEIPEQVMQPEIKKKPTAKRPRSSTKDYDEDKKMKKMKRKMQKDIEKRLKNAPPISNDVTERLQQFIEGDMINGSDLTLVIQKLLYFSDLKDNQNRLTMPFNQLKTCDFFKAHEKELLHNNKGEFDVQLIGPTLRMYNEKLTLKMWQVNSTQSYVLKTKWNDFVREHKDVLVENAIVQVWSFRKDGMLCFALAVVEKAPMMQL